MSKRIPLSEPVMAGNEWKYVKECEHYKINIDPIIKQEIATDQDGNTSITSVNFSLYGKAGKSIDVCETQHARIFTGNEQYNPYATEIQNKLFGENSWTLNLMHTYAVLNGTG